MKFKDQNKNKALAKWFALAVLLLTIGANDVAAQHTYNGQNYGDAFSKMLAVTSDMQTSMFNTINRVNSERRQMFPELAGGSRITQQQIANLCKPFPCGNEGMASGGSPRVYSAPVQPTYVPPPLRQFPITATDYRPMGGRILPDAVAASVQGDAQTKEAARLLANQFLDAFEKEGRRNNVANGYGFLCSVSIQVVTGRELSEYEEQQLISGFNNVLAVDPRFAAMSAQQKQVATEASVISGGFIAFLYAVGKQNNDAKMQADARQLSTAAIAYFFGVQIR